jgi:predicted enzyme related to lactoylglutathione lyase
MNERTRYPAGVPCWVDTAQPDPDAAVRFYGGLFDWEFEDSMPAGAPGRYYIARLRGGPVAAVGSPPDGAPPVPVWNTYVCVDNADATAAKVEHAGGQVIAPPFDVVDAGRMATFAGPGGAVFCVWQPRKHIGAMRVNEPGTWVSSDLNTRDLEGAKAFFGAMFGWELTPIDFGLGESGMWRLPGYSDFLERIDPGVRQRHTDAGAPEGFTDAIGWLQVMTSDQFPDSVPSHWAVTFSVDDTDAVAERAQKLGGTLTVPPMDVPYSRMAVVTDPQGAVFTISKYIPTQTP